VGKTLKNLCPISIGFRIMGRP